MIDTIDTYKIAVSRYPLTQKIPYGDPIWRRFNAGFDNMDLPVDALMQAIYEGKSITTWHRNNWRATENYQLGQHIGLDFDTADSKSTLAALAADRFIARYAALIYTTMSHTPEAPRARVIFMLDTPIMQAKNYTLAASALLWVFGAADRQCKDSVRFFYGSPNCDFEYVNQVLPLDVVRHTIDQYQKSGTEQKHRTTSASYHAPASQREVADALKFIPPWGIDYDDWLAVLMGVHAAFGEDGYALAENWADGKPGEVEQKWHSFHAGDGITVSSVFGIAKKFGWSRSSTP